MAGQGSRCGPSCAATHLTPLARQMVAASLAPRTQEAYRKAWDRLAQFCAQRSITLSIPVNTTILTNYLASLLEDKYSPSTIYAQASAFSFFHKLLGKPDPTDSFLVKKFLKGAKKVHHKRDARLPVTKPILRKMIDAIDHSVSSHNHRLLIKAIFMLAFAAFLRMGEICLQSGASRDRLIQRPDVSFEQNNKSLSGMHVVIREFKHSQAGVPVRIFIPVAEEAQYCPVRHLKNYLSTFCHSSGPLFQFINGLPVPYNFVAEKLHCVSAFLGLPTAHFKPHSFRIGAATSAFLDGHSEEGIQRMGRCRSSAVQNYIRMPVLQWCHSSG